MFDIDLSTLAYLAEVFKKNLPEYITKSKSKDYLFGIWYYILLYATQYSVNVKTKLLKFVIDSFCHMKSLLDILLL